MAEITTNAQGQATGATWIDATGTHRHLHAKTVILAANGVGNPRLLLMTKLANRTGPAA